MTIQLNSAANSQEEIYWLVSLIVTAKTKIKPESLPKALLTKRSFCLGQVNIPKEFRSFTSVGSNFTKKISKAKKALDQYVSPTKAETEYRDLNTDELKLAILECQINTPQK